MANDSGQQDNGSAALKPFGSVEFCPKCGTLRGGSMTWYEADSSYAEHMLIECKTCTYDWREATKDAQL